MRTFDIDPANGSAHLSAFRQAPESLVSLAGSGMLDGAALALFKSERLAASAGAVPWIEIPGGGLGVITIGRALDAKWQNQDARSLYLAQHRLMDRIHQEAAPAKASTARLSVPLAMPQTQLGAVPLAIYVAVAAVGVLATIGGAYYATRIEEKRIEVNGNALRQASAVSALTDLATTQLQTTGKIDPKLVGSIEALGAPTWAPSTMRAALYGAAGTAFLGLAGLLYFSRPKARQA